MPTESDSKPVTEEQRISSIRLGIPLLPEDYELAKEVIDTSFTLEPSSWEKALASEMHIEIAGLNRRKVRQLLYLDGKKKLKKGGQAASLRRCMAKLAQTEEFAPYFEAVRERLRPGVEVLQWHRNESMIVTCCNGNGYYGLKEKSSSVHYSSIQVVYRILAQ